MDAIDAIELYFRRNKTNLLVPLNCLDEIQDNDTIFAPNGLTFLQYDIEFLQRTDGLFMIKGFYSKGQYDQRKREINYTDLFSIGKGQVHKKIEIQYSDPMFKVLIVE